jgi:hypothetical protein
MIRRSMWGAGSPKKPNREKRTIMKKWPPLQTNPYLQSLRRVGMARKPAGFTAGDFQMKLINYFRMLGDRKDGCGVSLESIELVSRVLGRLDVREVRHHIQIPVWSCRAGRAVRPRCWRFSRFLDPVAPRLVQPRGDMMIKAQG